MLYAEPGGYYEHGIDWTKPVVACVVGRWKSKLTRAVGHAGAMAGSGDSAEDKERWFMEAFGVDAIFTPENPVVSKQGRRRHQHRRHPGGADRGDGAERRRARLRAARQPGAEAVDRPTTRASRCRRSSRCRWSRRPSPMRRRSRRSAARSAPSIARQNMKDKSGASVMDPKTQVTRVHGHEVLDLALQPLQAYFALPLVHEIAGQNDRAMLDIAVAAEVNLVGDPILVAADAARDAGNAPEHGDGGGGARSPGRSGSSGRSPARGR